MNNIYLSQFALDLSCLLIMQLGMDNLAKSGNYFICFLSCVKVVFVDVVLKIPGQFAQYILRY